MVRVEVKELDSIEIEKFVYKEGGAEKDILGAYVYIWDDIDLIHSIFILQENKSRFYDISTGPFRKLKRLKLKLKTRYWILTYKYRLPKERLDKIKNDTSTKQKLTYEVNITANTHARQIRGTSVKAIVELKAPNDYFIIGYDSNQYTEFVPHVKRSKVTYLINGVQTFKKIEEKIKAATDFVYIANWYFDPDIPLPSNSAKTFGQLLAEKANSGSKIRIILNDFDPAFGGEANLVEDWRLKLEAYRSSISRRDNFLVVKHLHEGIIRVENVPRNVLIEFARFRGRGGSVAMATDQQLQQGFQASGISQFHICSHHQKIMVISGLSDKCAFAGGIDLFPNRYNEAPYNPPTLGGDSRRWRDMHCMVTGPAVQDIEQNFVQRWNLQGGASLGYLLTLSPLKVGQNDKGMRIHRVQVSRTISRDAGTGSGEINVRRDIELTYKQAISQATYYIYIEQQYFRDYRTDGIVQWILDAARREPELQLIILLPFAPEEWRGLDISQEDPITRHGMYQQYTAFERLKRELGSRVGFFSMLKQEGTDYPSIYVHSKIAIIDDVWATIGSANVGLRSFLADTEMNVSFFHHQRSSPDDNDVKKFRVALWSELLGQTESTVAAWPLPQVLQKWNQTATNNDNRYRTKLSFSGYVVPHDYTIIRGQYVDPFLDKYT